MTRERVYEILNEERDYQIGLWGPSSEDEKKSLGDFMIFMEHYLDKAKNYWSIDAGFNAHEELRKVVALGIAAFEAHGVPQRL